MTARFWLTGLAPQRAPMTRILFSACFVLAAVAASATAVISPAVPGAGTAGAVAAVGTPLPPGWELCVLAGVAAPATRANVADLDEWQVAEGGSTNNAAAYNPFNTRRTTDAQGAPLPVASMVGGFPAFPDWLTGCSATVATLLQPNMAVITAALQAGNVAPPGQFLVDVDGSAWCAPSAAGQPCYETAIRGLGRQHLGRRRGLLGPQRLRKRAVRSARLSGRHLDCDQPAEHPSRSGPPSRQSADEGCDRTRPL